MRLVVAATIAALWLIAAPAAAAVPSPMSAPSAESAGSTQPEREPDHDRNYVADGVATVLGVIAVILIVRRRRQMRR